MLCAASAIVFFAWPSPHRNGDAVISQEMREERQRKDQEPLEAVRGLYRQIEKTFQAADGANMRK